MAFSLDQFYRLNRRALIWIILGVLIWLMRDFFGLVFLTFILAFITAPLAALGERRLHLGRRISIILSYGIFLIALVSFVRFVAPSVVREAYQVMNRVPQIQEKITDLKNQAVENYPSLGPIIIGYMRSVTSEDDLAKIDRQLPSLKEIDTQATTATTHAELQEKQSRRIREKMIRENKEQDLLIRTWMDTQTSKLVKYTPVFVTLLYRLTGTMLLALLFSFLITLDISRLREEVESLRASRLHDFYEQAAQPVVRFAYVLGRSFQAQAAIACINALLTMIGLLILGVPSLAVLTLFVFLCSFIPVLGVFISSTPILLVALNSGGTGRAAAALVMILLIHAIEAYLLNPIIYGRHLKLNPVLVLVILFVGHHAFGMWGMIMGVPVAYYFIHDVFGVPVWGERRIAPKNYMGLPPGAEEQKELRRQKAEERLRRQKSEAGR